MVHMTHCKDMFCHPAGDMGCQAAGSLGWGHQRHLKTLIGSSPKS